MNEDFRIKWENYWYHYKLRTFIILFLLFCVTYTLVVYLNTQKPDLIVTYVGSQRDLTSLEEILNSQFSSEIDDLNKDYKKIIHVKELVTSKAQIEIDLNFWQQVDVEMIAGNSYVYIIEDFAYNLFLKRGTLGSIEFGDEKLDFIDISNNQYFKTEQGSFGNYYMCVRNKLPDELNNEKNETIKNGYHIINKILQNR